MSNTRTRRCPSTPVATPAEEEAEAAPVLAFSDDDDVVPVVICRSDILCC